MKTSSAEGPQFERLAYRVQLKQDGARVTGRGQKWTENGDSLPPEGRTPITLEGTLGGRNLALKFTEKAAGQTKAGTLVLMLADDGVLRGSVTSSGVRSRGSSIAWRLRQAR